MAKPYIAPNQVFNLNFGEYFSNILNFTGTSPITFSAVGLPSGLALNTSTGELVGTPVESGVVSSYIIATNSEGSYASVIKFNIKKIPDSNVYFNISPVVGYAKNTKYQFTTNVIESLSAYSVLWGFGDGSVSDEINPKHTYNVSGNYIVSLNAYTNTGVVLLSSQLSVGLLLNESVYFDYVPPPTFAGHYNRYPFKLNFTSSEEGPHVIDLAAQYSRSYQYQSPRNKWSFLRPEWRFLDLNGNPITSIIPNETKIYCNDLGKLNTDGSGFVAGVTGSAEFYFVDDIHNFDLAFEGGAYTTVIATLQTSAVRSFNDSFNISDDLPSFSNSLATVSVPYMVLLRPPDNVKITENGIREYINPRWKESIQPIVINTNFENPFPEPYYWQDFSKEISIYNENKSFSHSFPLSGDMSLNVGVLNLSSTFTPSDVKFSWLNEDGYKSPGYYKGYFKTNPPYSFKTPVTSTVSAPLPNLSSQYFNPIIWVSNPNAGMMCNFQYINNPALSAAMNTPNMNIAVIKNFEMPVITEVDFQKDPMALSGFHGIYSIAATTYPAYHAWALDSEMNSLYRLTTNGNILCSIDINKIISDNNLGFLSEDQTSPVSMVLDSKQNIWITLYDTISTIKLDRFGNFLFATTPLSSTGYVFPPAPNIDGNWYEQNTYFDSDNFAEYDSNALNNIDLNFIEPTCVDSDSNDNIWVTYSYFASGYIVKYDKDGALLNTISYPVCSCPQQIVVDNQDNVWIALSNNLNPSHECILEKRNSNGVLLSSVGDIRGLNYLTLDTHQNPWFTFSYSWIGSVDNNNGTVFTTNLSGSNYTSNPPDWFDPDSNIDETCLEGIGCDLRGRIYVVNSLENQIYILDSYTKTFLDKFYVNPQGFTFTIDNQEGENGMIASLWQKSLQASGDWTGLRWMNKYGVSDLPFFTNNSYVHSISGTTKQLHFAEHEDYTSFKINENFDLAANMQSYAFIPSLRESTFLFEDFLGSIYGKYPFNRDDLGVSVYEKIANFVSNHSDVDYCNIDQLYNVMSELGLDVDKFDLNYPEEIQRLVNLASINQSRLFGAKSLNENYFTKVNNQDQTNRGDLITSFCYTVSAGQKFVLKDKTINKYDLIETSEINGCSAYSLSVLAEFLGFNSYDWSSYYEFYEFNNSYDLKQLEGIIDWSNPQTTINETLSSSKYWFGPEGLLDLEFSYEIYKGLGFINK